MNLSRNDFMGCLAETPDKDGAALMASNRENKRVLDDVKFQVLADAPVLSPEQKADIELAFENEISIDESARLAL
ncbi:23087_t:CDS:2 [Rhizophagus irregularis]|nr:23087_t:CDS:2 [Rhizophagus irregularis]